MAAEEPSSAAPAQHYAVLTMFFHSFTRCFFLFRFLGAAPGSLPSAACCRFFSAAAGRELWRGNSPSYTPEVPFTATVPAPSLHTHHSQTPPFSH